MLFIGCHLSSSGGYVRMAETAQALGANTFQFFTRNPRGGNAKDIAPEDAAAFCRMQEAGEIGKIVAHAAYTINPCAKDEATLRFARRMMADDLLRMELTPGNFYNFHPGSHVGQGIEQGIEIIVQTLDEILFPEQRTTVLLETMAGKGSEVGSRFEELRAILDRVKLPEKMGVCLDSCHVFDGGYDIVNDLDGVLDEFDRIIGLDRLYALHLNDSKNPLGSHKDRHEKIGQGEIGEAALAALICHPRLRGRPVILETPNELPDYAGEISRLRAHYGAAESERGREG